MSSHRFTLQQVAQWLECDWQGEPLPLTGVATDTRTLNAGELFIALRGPNHDGHDHVAAAIKAGAVAAVVSRRLDDDIPQLIVDDTRLALGRLASGWRLALDLPLVAVTGSNGKTTVKEMIAAILAQAGVVRATQGNLNNDIGVPLTLLTLDHGDDYAVVEMGANHHGEIAYLTELARPDVAIITNAGSAHLEGFGSLEGVAEAKGEIYDGLCENGTAVINADDRFAPLWRDRVGNHSVITFGLNPQADVRGSWSPRSDGGVLTLHYQGNRIEVPLSMSGEHNARNALAATAAAIALDISLPRIAKGLASIEPVPGRLEWASGVAGATLINDSYNANPTSLSAAIDVLAAQPGRRLLVLGDMGELGGDAAALHAAAGSEARKAGIDGLYATGEMALHAVESFGDNGFHFNQQADLIDALQRQLDSDVTLLVKGSRSSRMERVVEALTAERGGAHAALS